jgi:hypothetical protein
MLTTTPICLLLFIFTLAVAFFVFAYTFFCYCSSLLVINFLRACCCIWLLGMLGYLIDINVEKYPYLLKSGIILNFESKTQPVN